jgi:hypothetical protein
MPITVEQLIAALSEHASDSYINPISQRLDPPTYEHVCIDGYYDLDKVVAQLNCDVGAMSQSEQIAKDE